MERIPPASPLAALPAASCRQRGSALTLILVAVALFAALSFTVAGMMRGGGGEHVGEQKSSLLADEILAYAARIRQAVQGLRISGGCDPAQVSFEGPGLTGYAHTPAAAAGCTVFHESGAGLVYLRPSADFGGAADWVFTGGLNVQGVGTDCTTGEGCTDLLAVLPGISLPVCKAVNKKLRITPDGTPPVQDDPLAFAKFTGDLTYAATLADQAGAGALEGQMAGCSKASGSESYFFYQVLVAR